MEVPSSLPNSAQPESLPQPHYQAQPQLLQKPQHPDPQNPQIYDQSQYLQQSNHIQDYYYHNPAQAYDQSYYSYYHQYPYQNQWQYPQQPQTYAYYQPDYSAAYSQPVSHQQEPVPAVSAPYEGTQIAVASGAGAPPVPQQPQQHQQSAYTPVQTSGNPVVPPGMNPAAAAAITALQQLTQFAGTMDAAERALASHPAYNPSSGPVTMRPPDARHSQRGRGRRGGSRINGSVPLRGRGRGRSSHVEDKGAMSSSSHPETSAAAEASQPAPAPNQLQLQIAWCELCRVDCSSFEILEQHKNGKRHKKNLLRLEELKNKVKTGEEIPINNEPSVPINPEAVQQPQAAQIVENHKAVGNLLAESSINDAITLPEVPVETSSQQEKKPRTCKLDNRRHGLKRKMKGGRGGKRIRTSETQKRPIEPRKPKVVIPLICELCNIKCDTQEVLGRHLSGKKHIAKLKRFEGHQAMYGSQGLQVLYPPNSIAQTQFISQGHQPYGNYAGSFPSRGGSFQQSTAAWNPQVSQSFVPQVPEPSEANPTAAIW